jgi:hypothetical protein
VDQGHGQILGWTQTDLEEVEEVEEAKNFHVANGRTDKYKSWVETSRIGIL